MDNITVNVTENIDNVIVNTTQSIDNITANITEIVEPVTITISSTRGDTGPQGEPGIDGSDGEGGYTPIKGLDYFDGIDGVDGTPGAKGDKGDPGVAGANGVGVPVGGTANQVLAKIDAVDFNTQWVDQTGGTGGENGIDGVDGREVLLQKSSTHIQWKYDTDVTWNDLVPLSELKGETGSQGLQGIQGIQGIAGTNGTNGVGVPAGGTTNQLLAKIDSTDYNTIWIDAPEGTGPSSGGTVNVIDLSSQIPATHFTTTATLLSGHFHVYYNGLLQEPTAVTVDPDGHGFTCVGFSPVAGDKLVISFGAGETPGDVIGPTSSIDEHIAVFDGVDGKKIKDGGVVPLRGGYLQWFPPLALSNWTWINQGSATASETSEYISLITPSATGDNLRILKKVAPATPYTITACLLIEAHVGNLARLGLIWRQSSDGKVISVEYSFPGLTRNVLRWNTATSFNGAYVVNNSPFGSPIWIQISDTGVNRISRFSLDGINFIQEHTVSRTDFFTADEVGLFVLSSNGFAAAVTLISWKEA